MRTHPNKRYFIGIIPCVDVPSAKSPQGARGHGILLTKQAVIKALPSLIGMGVNVNGDFTGHRQESKIGVIEGAEIQGNSLVLSGYLFSHDVPKVIETLEASADWGMSYETVDSHVEDMRASVYYITRLTFTGAAILKRDKAAYAMTDFILV